MSQTDSGLERRSPPGTPRWVKVFGIMIVVLVVLFAISHLAGNGHGPMEHMHMPPTQQGMPMP
ncbi:MAG TPA: hypothetical protein VKQ72_03165 [Aggregatilineales bacterium]|nr:hypothetical protein [Aggregatilineales bacterium]